MNKKEQVLLFILTFTHCHHRNLTKIKLPFDFRDVKVKTKHCLNVYVVDLNHYYTGTLLVLT